MNILEGELSEIEGRIFVTQRVNSHVENLIDRQEQYSRRPTLVINGMTESSTEDNRDVDNIANTLEKERGIDKDTILTNIDKAHPIERVENGKQLRIVKFRSDHFKKVIYKKHE